MNEDLKWLAENVHEWKDGCSVIQKDDYGSYVFLCGSDPEQYVGVGDVCFTRAQWQAARDELGLNHSVDFTEKVWRGPEDGLPPVGSAVEAWFDDGKVCWHKAHVIGFHPAEKSTLAVSLIGDHESRLIWSDMSGIRPLRSEEDKAIQEMLCIMEGGSGTRAARALYRAGYRKQEAE